MDLTARDQELVDSKAYGDFELAALIQELLRLKIENAPMLDKCPMCEAELAAATGYVGETILYCPSGCGIQWEDSEGAIARAM